MAIYGYTRVSTTGQSQNGGSLDVQARQLSGWAQMKGVELDMICSDPATSGSIPVTERPEGAKMMAKLKKGDAIVAVKLDRLFRDARDCLNTVHLLRERGVSLFLLDMGFDDLCSNGLSRFFLTMASGFAEMERERIRERILTTKADRRERGKFNGGYVPFGFTVGPDKQLQEVPEQQTVIRRVRSMREAGSKFQQIKDALAADGVKISMGLLHKIASAD